MPNTPFRKIRPTHPGEMLRKDFLPDYGLTAAALASASGVSRQTINELLRCHRAVSPEMALRLSRLFGNTPEFWRNAQRAVDLFDAAQTPTPRACPDPPWDRGRPARCLDARPRSECTP